MGKGDMEITDITGKRFIVEPLVEIDPVELAAGRITRAGEIIEAEYSIHRGNEVSIFDLIAWHKRNSQWRR